MQSYWSFGAFLIYWSNGLLVNWSTDPFNSIDQMVYLVIWVYLFYLVFLVCLIIIIFLTIYLVYIVFFVYLVYLVQWVQWVQWSNGPMVFWWRGRLPFFRLLWLLWFWLHNWSKRCFAFKKTPCSIVVWVKHPKRFQIT